MPLQTRKPCERFAVRRQIGLLGIVVEKPVAMIQRNEDDPSASPVFNAKPIVAKTIPVKRRPVFHSE